MKCIHCGHENKEGSKFCTYCGAPLTVPSAASLDAASFIELAEAYTGNLAAAKKIVSANANDIRTISEACTAWIRAKDPVLFQNAEPSEANSPLLDAIGKTEDTLRDLDYEERICVLMHCLEKMEPQAIANILNIPEDAVRYYLQCAYEKTHPTKIQTPINHPDTKKKAERRKRHVRHRDNKEETENSPKFLKNITMQTKIIVAVIAAVIIGSFLGIKNYAHNEYLRGTALLAEEKYEEAAEPLLNAKRYGGSEDAGLKLGDVYYAQGDYTKALQEYLACSSSQKGVKDALIRTYEKLADASVTDRNYGTAAEYLQKQYDLDEDDHTNIRLQAVQNNGTYTDEDGNIFNAWGDPVKLCAVKKGKTLYQVDLEYNDDRTLKAMKEYVSNYTSKVNYNQFADDQRIEASWILKDDGTVTYSVEAASYDEHDNPLLQTVTTSSSIKKTNYSYTYEEDQIASASVRSSTGTVKAEYTYKDDQLVEIKNDDGTSTVYKYDRKGNLVHETETEENGDIITETAYEYDDNGRVKEKTVKRNKTDSILPYADNEDILYTYTEQGDPYTLIIRNNNSQVAKGYYIDGTGWIILYDTAEE
ncbi:MAG: zinc-ribbon domain-containing protein [Solobacterium sp.]|jgi:YD repeat-containing protein|nr:zinc-ribbon domain-containing protein [Solobacterium sp.]MCH4205443.1 zinc-ribbon domain-containing protein [Solobacterium sp.]MCH4226655.1 zinc-ribbon domain-containing protein [Solobacterium sp.]MCH4282130.1 zinc-ribbon domain-containing protein [Solobacterium sp.]